MIASVILTFFLVGGIMPNGNESISMTIIYDNNFLVKGLKPDWGFSCFIKGMEKTILFDTGTDGKILLSNMEKLDIDPRKVDIIFLSHIHGDHTGGLWDFLKENSNVSVYVPASFPDIFKKKVKSYGAELVEVSKEQKICEGIYSTGELGTSIEEQSLVIKSGNGLIVITGCAHPGIVEIVRKAKEICDEKLYLVFGGFHLISHSQERIKKIIQEFKNLGVVKAGPCHCSGEQAMQLFSEEYGEDFVKIGVGKVIGKGNKKKKESLKLGK